ncbi:MAG: hypothetical protein AAGG59_03640 [Bacteroidota bacterium]
MTAAFKSNFEILIDLARVDRELHPSELAFIIALIAEYKLNPSEFQQLGKLHSNSIDKIKTKSEFLYLALKLMKIDNHITLSELGFCKNVVLKLGFKPAVVDYFADSIMENPVEFKSELTNWMI